MLVVCFPSIRSPSLSWTWCCLHRDPSHSSGHVKGLRVRLSTFRPTAGSSLSTDIPALRSIIEFATRDDAQRAITEFTDKTLLGRPIFIREVRSPSPPRGSSFYQVMCLPEFPILFRQDREQEARFGAPPSMGRAAMMGGHGGMGGFGGGGYGGGFQGGGGFGGSFGGGSNQIYIGNVCAPCSSPL